MIVVKCDKKIRDFFVLLLFLLVLFTPNVKFLPKYTWILAGLGCLTLLDRPFVKRICFYGEKNLKFVCLSILVMLFLALPPLLFRTGDMSYIELQFGTILTALRSLLLIYVLYKVYKKNIFEKYCEILINACCINVLFTIAFIVFPDFKDFWMNEILVSQQTPVYFKYQYRYSLSGFAAFMTSSFFSVAVIICAYMLSLDPKKTKNLFKFILIVAGCFFYGRVTFFGILLAGILLLFSRGDRRKKTRLFLNISMIAILLIILVNYLASINDDFLVWKDWAFAFVEQLFVDGEVTDYSVTHMFEDMYFMPKPLTFLFGDGRYFEPLTSTYYMNTDVGYMRLILYSGIFGMLVAFVPMLYLLRKTYKLSNNANQRLLFFLIFFAWGILEAKGDMYHRVIMIVYPMFLALMASKNFLDQPTPNQSEQIRENGL